MSNINPLGLFNMLPKNLFIKEICRRLPFGAQQAFATTCKGANALFLDQHPCPIVNMRKFLSSEKSEKSLCPRSVKTFGINGDINYARDFVPEVLDKIAKVISHSNFITLSLFSCLKNLKEVEFPEFHFGRDETHSKLKLPTSITKVVLREANIDGLSELSHLENLEELDLSNSSFSSDQLMKLPKSIKRLNLSNTEINDLSGLSHLENLIEINLSGCKQITSMELSQLSNTVISIDLSRTNIDNLEGMSHLTNLLELNLNDCSKIVSEHLAQLSEFSRHHIRKIFLARTDISDLKPLSHMPLEEVNLSKLSITNEQLAMLRLASLKTINLDYTRVDVSILSKMPDLRELSLRGNSRLIGYVKITDEEISQLPSTLQRLDLTGQPIHDLYRFSHMIDLIELNLTGSEITSEQLGYLPVSIDTLILNNTKIDDLSRLRSKYLVELHLEGCKSLKNDQFRLLSASIVNLNLADTKISDLENISHMRYLEKLNLEDCEINDLSALSLMRYLKEVNVRGCETTRKMLGQIPDDVTIIT